MKWLRPKSADSGLRTVLLVNDAELAMLAQAVKTRAAGENVPQWKKLNTELETARKAL